MYFYYNAQNTLTREQLATARSRGHGSDNSFNCDAELKKKKKAKIQGEGFPLREEFRFKMIFVKKDEIGFGRGA